MSDKIDDNNSTWIGILFIILGFILVILCAAGIWWCQLFFFDDIYFEININNEDNDYIWLPPLLNIICYIFTATIIFFFYKTILSYISKIKTIHGNSLSKWRERVYLTKTINRITKAYSTEEAETILEEFNDAYNENNIFTLSKIMVNLNRKEDKNYISNMLIVRAFKYLKTKFTKRDKKEGEL